MASLPDLRERPVTFLSAYGGAQHVAKALEPGAQALLADGVDRPRQDGPAPLGERQRGRQEVFTEGASLAQGPQAGS